MEKSPSSSKINYTLAVITQRKIDNGNSIKYYNDYYQPYKNSKLMCFKAKTECLVIKAFDDTLLTSIDNEIYTLKLLNKHKSYSDELDEIPEKKAERTKYIPSANHPWRLDKFKKHVNQSHTTHKYT